LSTSGIAAWNHILEYLRLVLRITLTVGDDFVARISETEGFAGLAKCGERKQHKGRIARLLFSGTRTARTGR